MALEGWTAERLDGAGRIWKKEGRELTARFSGTSMHPTIPDGAEVRVLCGEEVRAGDVVVCQEGRRILVHRAVAILGSGWVLTRGDATAVPDLPVPASSVLGRITGLVTREGDLAVPKAPDTAARRWTLRACGSLLLAAPPAGRNLVRALWILRKWFVLAPRAAARRLRPGIGAPGEQD